MEVGRPAAGHFAHDLLVRRCNSFVVRLGADLFCFLTTGGFGPTYLESGGHFIRNEEPILIMALNSETVWR